MLGVLEHLFVGRLAQVVEVVGDGEPDVLFVRFEYDDHNSAQETDEESFYNDFRREAYKEADIDTVRMIRQLAQDGQLDAPLQ